ncbi:MAG: nitroreductase family protein [Deltaproteobacteria bacterium]|nr:nitroreductase family protein [Deltaproteobacteria bacterium]
MNAVIEAIKKRRSVRAYDARPIPRDMLNTVIEAGNEAPSAMNSQPWRFVVVEDSEAKRKLLGAASLLPACVREHDARRAFAGARQLLGRFWRHGA